MSDVDSISRRRKAQDRSDMGHWFPRIEQAGLPVPPTALVNTKVELIQLLDHQLPEGWHSFVECLKVAAQSMGYPCFLRTGHGSGKHDWKDTCFLASEKAIEQHIYSLVEWSELAGFPFGLSVETWAVRKMLDVAPIFHCELYGGMPVIREFRIFVKGRSVAHHQPYWPPDSVQEGRPSVPDWRERLAVISAIEPAELKQLGDLAVLAGQAAGGGHWSVDFLQDAEGRWWLTDMADGYVSFLWKPLQAGE